MYSSFYLPLVKGAIWLCSHSLHFSSAFSHWTFKKLQSQHRSSTFIGWTVRKAQPEVVGQYGKNASQCNELLVGSRLRKSENNGVKWFFKWANMQFFILYWLKCLFSTPILPERSSRFSSWASSSCFFSSCSCPCSSTLSLFTLR